MLQTLKLLLPSLIPSWRFFDVIAPSPRVEYTLLKTADDAPYKWQEFRQRPAHITPFGMLKRLFWNPRWNESLFLMSCTERLMQNPTEHSQKEIFKRIEKEVKHQAVDASYLQFRLVFISRDGEKLNQHIAFTSPIRHRGTGAEHGA